MLGFLRQPNLRQVLLHPHPGLPPSRGKEHQIHPPSGGKKIRFSFPLGERQIVFLIKGEGTSDFLPLPSWERAGVRGEAVNFPPSYTQQ